MPPTITNASGTTRAITVRVGKGSPAFSVSVREAVGEDVAESVGEVVGELKGDEVGVEVGELLELDVGLGVEVATGAPSSYCRTKS